MPRRKRAKPDSVSVRQVADDRLVRTPLTPAEMRDELDEFEEKLTSGAPLAEYTRGAVPQQRSVLEFDDDSDDDGDDEYVDAYNFGGEEVSENDDDNEEIDGDDGDMPNEHAWGRAKRTYYGSQCVDESWRGAARERVQEMADMEQQEALAIQQRMAKLLATDQLQLGEEEETGDKTAEDVSANEHVQLNISQLSSLQQDQLLMQKSPELLPLIRQLKSGWKQLINTAEPLFQRVEDGYIVEREACDFISCYRRLLLAQSLNIVHYLSQRSHRSCVDSNHPVLRRIAQLTQLLNTVQPVVEKLKPDFEKIVALVSSGVKLIKQKIPDQSDDGSMKESQARDEWQKQRSVIQKEMQQLSMEADVLKKEQNQRKHKTQTDTQKALSFSESRQAGQIKHHPLDPFRRKRALQIPPDHLSTQQAPADGTSVEKAVDDVIEKRPITHQIARNKGLMPKRSRESRNPRVKHKVKFQKALKKRRSMVRIPRKEVHKYGGEMCGIRVGTVKSRPIK